MTVEELIQKLQQLPGAAQTATVCVDGKLTVHVDYSRGNVFIDTDNGRR